MSRFSKWFSCGDQQPVLTGFYDVKYQGDSQIHHQRYYWNGKEWTHGPTRGSTVFGVASRWPKDKWRGLGKKP